MSETGKPREFSGQDARQDDVILRTPVRKAVFVAGLAVLVLLAALVTLSGCVPTP